MAPVEAGNREVTAKTRAGTSGGQDGPTEGGLAVASCRATRRDAGSVVRLVAGDGWRCGQHGDDESDEQPSGLDPEKKSLTASERNETARAAWREAIRTVQPEDLVFLDETGSHLGYTPTHAWAPCGVRASAPAPVNRGENMTVIAALTLEGVGPRLRFDGAMTADRFVGYVRHILGPALRPGQLVVMDNLRAHHAPGVRAAIEARGATVLHLPPYSPDFNPIEEAFSKVKQALRRAEPRTDDDLRSAIWAAFDTITPRDAAGWFAHSGYAANHQPS